MALLSVGEAVVVFSPQKEIILKSNKSHVYKEEFLLNGNKCHLGIFTQQNVVTLINLIGISFCKKKKAVEHWSALRAKRVTAGVPTKAAVSDQIAICECF